jgi:hypothetical protein
MFVSSRDQARQFFLDVWRKHQDQSPLEPVEQMVLAVVLEHPEYRHLLEDPEASLAKDYTPEMGQTNPFLHMGMHIALREQVSTDRPAGIKQVYENLVRRSDDPYETEHRMMECLGEALWLAQRNNQLPDETAYLQCLQSLV